MSTEETRLPDPARSKLRAAVAAVEGSLPPGGPDGFQAAWRSLVDLLALGPEPKYHKCPTCGWMGMHDATVCGHCWTKLTPPSTAA